MIKHDLMHAKHKKAQPGTWYVPREHNYILKNNQQSTNTFAIQAVETSDESNEDKELHAALREE